MNSEFPWEWFPLYFIGLWVSICVVISLAGGWFQLAQSYRASGDFIGPTIHWQSGSLRYVANYRSCLITGSNESGLYLGVCFLFRVAHPPLFIPWSDVSITHGKLLFWRYAGLKFAKCPSTSLQISETLARRLLENGPLRFEAA